MKISLGMVDLKNKISDFKMKTYIFKGFHIIPSIKSTSPKCNLEIEIYTL